MNGQLGMERHLLSSSLTSAERTKGDIAVPLEMKVNSGARCNIVGGFDIRLLSHKKTMLPCQDILTSPVPKGTRLPI